MNFDTGSFSRTLPSSISIRMATPVIGLDMEAIQNRPSLGMGFVGCQIHQAMRFEMRDAALTRDQGNGAGDVVRVNVALDGFMDSLQAVRRKADLFRFAGWDGRRRQRQGENREHGGRCGETHGYPF